MKIKVEILEYAPNKIEFAFQGSLSVNRLYRNVKGRTKPYIQAKHIVYNKIMKNYKDAVLYDYNKHDFYYVKYTFVFNSKKPRDVSNYIKFFEDLVFRIFIKDDDNKVWKFEAQKEIRKGFKHNYVMIEWFNYERNEHFLEEFSEKSSLNKIYIIESKPKSHEIRSKRKHKNI